MPRPTTKETLIGAANEQWSKMWAAIAALPTENVNLNLDASDGKEAHWGRDKNVRDILIHLFEWHLLLLDWVNNQQSGVDNPFLPAPYNWKTYGDMNIGFWQKHQDTSYEEAKKLLTESHHKVLSLLDRFTDDELFEKKHFKWTGTTNLGSYFVSTMPSHYDWAIKKIKTHIKKSKG
jgi:hypothetical protein